MPAIGGGVQQQIVRGRFQRAVQYRLQRLVGTVIGLEGQIIAEHQKTPGLAADPRDYRGQMHEVSLVDLDQPQTLVLPGVQQSPDQGGLAGSPGTPQQGIVGRQATDELTGVGLQQLLLPIHADQVIQALFSGDLQWPQPAATALAHPAGGKGVTPVQRRCRWWQGRLIAVEEAETRCMNSVVVISLMDLPDQMTFRPGILTADTPN